jgi:hypothetical protein
LKAGKLGSWEEKKIRREEVEKLRKKRAFLTFSLLTQQTQ